MENSTSLNNYEREIESTQSEILGLVDTVLSCAVVNVISILGVIGNALNVIVLCHHDLSESTTILLLAMSTADLCFLVTSIPKRFVCVLSKFDRRSALVLNVYATVYLWMPNRYCGLVSSGLVTLVAVERFLAVRFPLKVSVFITGERMVVIILILCVFWAVLTGPFFALYSVDWISESSSGILSPQIVLSDFIEKDPAGYNTLNVSLAIIRGPVSVVTIIVCSLAIVLRLFETNRRMTKGVSLPRNARDLRVLRMLLAVTSVYAVIGIPLSVPYIVFYVTPYISVRHDGTLTELAILIEVVNDFLYVLNASVNFVIYVTMSRKFYSTYITIMSKFRSHVTR